MEEAHRSRYYIHPGSTEIYRDLKGVYSWSSMKKGIAYVIAKFTNFQQVKVGKPKSRGLAQNIELSKKK